MTEQMPWDIQAAIEIGGLFAYRWERREMMPILKEEVATIINKHLKQHSQERTGFGMDLYRNMFEWFVCQPRHKLKCRIVDDKHCECGLNNIQAAVFAAAEKP